MKRKTKEQREAAAKAALRQRVEDIAMGAAGFDFTVEGEFATANFLSRFMPALKVQFGYDRVPDETKPQKRESNHYLFALHNLEHFDNIDSTADFLFENGVRA
jgi:hypothetical protein